MKPHEDRYKIALAEIAIKIAKLEQTILRLVSREMKINWKLTACFLGSDSTDTLIAKLEKIIYYFVDDFDASKDFEPINTKLNQINERRNTYVHSYYRFSGGNYVFRRKHKKRFGAKSIIDIKPVSMKTLNEYTRLIDKTTKDLQWFFKKNRPAITTALNNANQIPSNILISDYILWDFM